MSYRTRPSTWLWLGLALLTCASRPSVAQQANQPPESADQQWVKVLRGEDGDPQAMQTAIVRYKPAKGQDSGVVVDLIGAIHIGDMSYYEALNRQFEEYDVLLYELVAPEGTKIERGASSRSSHPVGALQNSMKDLLELDHQLGVIDYTQENFVHADMTPDEFTESMAERGEGFMQMFFRMMGLSIAEQSKQQAAGKTTDFDLLIAFFQPDRALRLKRLMADQFADTESLLVGFSGPDGSTIITERNKKALRVLSKQIAAGKKKIGIFYGAGHMDDMGERLEKEFQLQPAETFWVEAWNLRD